MRGPELTERLRVGSRIWVQKFPEQVMGRSDVTS